jgi:chromosome segregation ATPase
MASSTRDVKLTLGIDVDGAEDIEKLAGELDALANEGKDTADAFGISGVAAGRLQEAIAELSSTTNAHRAAESAAQAEAKATKRTLEEQREALARLQIAYQTAGGNADKYKADVLQLRTAILDSRAALRQKQDALSEAATSARIAAAQEKALSDQIVRASGQLNQSAEAYRKQGAAATASGRQQTEALTKAGSAAAALKSALGQIAAGNLIADGIGNLVGRVKELGA